MFDLIRPLLSFRKYLIAHRVLKILRKFGATLLQEGNTPSYKKVYGWFLVKNFTESGIKCTPEYILLVIDMLSESGDLERKAEFDSQGNFDILRLNVRCTSKGEQSFIDGIYINKVYKFWISVIGIPGGIIGIIALLRGIL